MVRLLPDALDRDLRTSAGITLPDYEVLVVLSEAPDHRVRMADLAEATYGSRSRTTHQIAKMENAGWVTRERCAEDARGQWAVLTESGWDLLKSTAPTHVESVREHLLDVLGPRDFAEFGRLCTQVLDGLGVDRNAWQGPGR
jgi:DNA-binding MarR family transcriptional regulator